MAENKAPDGPTPEMFSAVFSALGKKGGAARAKSLTKARRVAIAKKAVNTRWAKARAKGKKKTG